MFVTIVDEPEISLADSEVGIEESLGDFAVDHVPVVAHHGPLLEARPLRAVEGHPAAVAVAQVIGLEDKKEGEQSPLCQLFFM